MESPRSFVVIGLGTFGSHAARALMTGGATVLAVDISEQVIDEFAPEVTQAVSCDALDVDAMRAAGALDADVFVVAVRRRFDTTVLIVHMLRQNGINEIVALVDSQQEAEAIKVLGATSVVFPERDMAERLARSLLLPDLADMIPLGPDVSIIQVPCPSSFVGQSLIGLDLRKRYAVSVIALAHANPAAKGNRVTIESAPNPELPLKATDSLILLGKVDRLAAFKEAHE